MASGKQEPGTDLIVRGEESTFMVLRHDLDEVAELVKETLDGEALQPQDLDRVKVPGSGGQTWELITADGDEVATKTIEGIILDAPIRRSYWEGEYEGGGEPPNCYSLDGKVGIGEPGGSCADCPLNEYETAAKGKGKACKETRQLFILMSDSLIPIVLNVPPASLANFKQYRIRTLRGGSSLTGQTTIIGLEKDKNDGGIDFSKVTFKKGTKLDTDASAMARAYGAMLRPADVVTTVGRDDVEEAA